MCGMAMKQQQKESLHLLIPLITSSFLRCAPVFQHTSVSFCIPSLIGWLTGALCVSTLHCPLFPAPMSLSQFWHHLISLAKNETLLNVFCATKTFSSSLANCLSTYRLALSCPTSICLILTLFSWAQDFCNGFFPENVCLLLFYLWAGLAPQPWSFILFI